MAGNDDVRRRLTGHIERDGRNSSHGLQRHQDSRGHRPGDDSHQSKSKAPMAFVAIGLFHILILVLVHYRANSYPNPKEVATSNPTDFIEENARRHLDAITSLGPRIAGGDANKKSEEYIIEQIKQIQVQKQTSNTIDLDVQVMSGGFTLDFKNMGIGEFSSVYQDLRNIVVKVSPPPNAATATSVLINCHYDTAIGSPGAGDDAISCCLMLEILRALSITELSLKHNLIFLFNGAEENILQTSHGFITQHPWAPSIKAFVNLDSAGAGGWEMVFQTGPEHPWLVKAYIESALYPSATVIGQEIFQTGLVPSETDYRIFRDYGKIPGLDIAYTKNGYVYHTPFDQARFIPPGCMQRGGENIKALITTLSQSSKVADPGEDKHGKLVFFDYVGYFMVAYPARIAAILNWTTFVFIFASCLKRIVKDSAGSPTALKQMGLMVLFMFITWILCVAVPCAVGFLLTVLGRSLSYYTYCLNIVWLFVLPAVVVNILFHHTLKKTVFKNVPSNKIVPMVQDANLILWSLVLALMTSLGVMSAFVPFLCTVWPAVFHIFLNLFGLKPTSVTFNLISSFIPSFFMLHIVYGLLVFLIPIMGRAGMDSQPDVAVAALTSLAVIVCLPYHIGFVYTHRDVGRVIYATFAVIGLGFLAVMFTPAGFPFSSSTSSISIQRALMVHYDRNFHSPTSDVIKRDSHIWYQPIDRHGTKFLEQYAPDVFAQGKQATCDGVYCGRPYFYPFIRFVDPRKTLDFPASPLPMAHVNANLVHREKLSSNRHRLSFTMSGPSHVTIFITELPGVDVKGWSFGHGTPIEIFTVPPIHEPTFFIYYSHHGPPNTTWEFNIEVEATSQLTANSSLVKMGFAGHFLHGPNQITKDLEKLDNQLPKFIRTVMWSATYDEYFF